MFKIQRKFVESCLLILLLLTLFLLASLSATAQEPTNSQVVPDKVARKGERAAMKQPNNFQPRIPTLHDAGWKPKSHLGTVG